MSKMRFTKVLMILLDLNVFNLYNINGKKTHFIMTQSHHLFTNKRPC